MRIFPSPFRFYNMLNMRKARIHNVSRFHRADNWQLPLNHRDIQSRICTTRDTLL